MDLINLSQKEIEEEGRKQLGGIKILIWVILVITSIVFLFYLSLSIGAFFEDIAEGFSFLIAIFLLYGSRCLLCILSLVGIQKRKAYSVPIVRSILVLLCFNLIGLILVLTIFWQRINNPYTKLYLNYFNKSNQTVLNLNNVKELENNSFKYCYFCGEKNPIEAIFCKKCGEKQEK